jgi:hypothetical protein
MPPPSFHFQLPAAMRVLPTREGFTLIEPPIWTVVIGALAAIAESAAHPDDRCSLQPSPIIFPAHG